MAELRVYKFELTVNDFGFVLAEICLLKLNFPNFGVNNQNEMKKLICLFAIAMLFSNTILSQTIEWFKTFGGLCADVGNSLTIGQEGEVFTIGNYCETVDFDPGMDSFNLTGIGSGNDIFIQKAKEVHGDKYDYS